MIININLAGNNVIYYYDIEKDEPTKEYNACAYRSFSSKEQDLFPVLKDIITAKKEVDTESFITKLNKVFKHELTSTRSFGQTAKQIVMLMNSYKYKVHNLRQPLVLSIPYLDGKPLPKIEKICLIDNNMYFVTKYKKEYIMHAVNDENMKCMIPLSNIIVLYKKLKKAASARKNIKKKTNTKSSHFSNVSSLSFQMEEVVVSTPTPTTGIHFTRNPYVEPVQPDTRETLRGSIRSNTGAVLREPRSPERVNRYETIPLREPPIRQNDNGEEIIEIPTIVEIPNQVNDFNMSHQLSKRQVLERSQPEFRSVEQSEPEIAGQPEQVEPEEVVEPIEQFEPEIAGQPEQVEPEEFAEPSEQSQGESSTEAPSLSNPSNRFYYERVACLQVEEGALSSAERRINRNTAVNDSDSD